MFQHKTKFIQSIAHAKVLGYLKNLDSRSKKYILVGYALNGYRQWDEEQREIKALRVVVFSELELESKNLNTKLKSNYNILKRRKFREPRGKSRKWNRK